MTKCIAFHSYKGGTGKTTLACNSAIILAKRGYSVCLLDLDIYAPSFHLYFSKEPRKWINDFLTSSADIRDVMIDVTDSLNNQRRQSDTIKSIKRDDGNEVEITGKLWVGFSNPQKKEIFKLEIADAETKRQAIRRFVQFREILTSEFGADYIIVDTSPGIRFWSINSLAIADILLLTLKMSDLDIDGTKIVAEEIYRFFIELGARCFLYTTWFRVIAFLKRLSQIRKDYQTFLLMPLPNHLSEMLHRRRSYCKGKTKLKIRVVFLRILGLRSFLSFPVIVTSNS